MKKLILILMAVTLLTACAAPVDYETLGDTILQPKAAQQKQMVLDMPQEAASPTLQSQDGGKLYHCDGYTLAIQTFSAGDLEGTLQTVTGQTKAQLQPIKTATEYGSRYDFIWTAAGETDLQLGRACLLDDGNYHYVLSVMAGQAETGRLRQTWQNIFDTCRLIDGDINLDTGS